MTHNISSEWNSRIQGTKPSLTRQFFIGTSDYSDYVLKWPLIKSDWIKMSPNNVTINLANEDRTFNFLREDGLGLTYECSIKLGQITAVDSLESITFYAGKIDKFKYVNGACNVSIVDRWDTLTHRIIGTEDVPQDYTTSNYLPSDLAWYVCTSHGGLSAVESTSNTDIDYGSFLEWAAVMSGDNIIMNAYLKGIKAADVLRKIGRLTNTAIFVSHDNELTFKRFSIVDSNEFDASNDNIINLTLDVRENDIINKFYQKAGYSVASNYHTITVFDTDSDSVNSFGLHEETDGDTSVWFVNTASALDSAQRHIQQYSLPADDVKATTTLGALPYVIGETLTVNDSLLNIYQGYRIVGKDVDYDKGMIKMRCSRRLFLNGFILDASSLDGTDVLT